MDGKKENPAPMHPLIPFYSNQCALCPSLPKIASSKASLSLCMYSSRSIARNRFFGPSPLPFGESTVLSLTRGPAGSRTTTGRPSATQECRDTNCTTRTTVQLQENCRLAQRGKKAARVGEAGTSSSSGDQESVMDHPIGGQLSKGTPGRSHTGPRRLLP